MKLTREPNPKERREGILRYLNRAKDLQIIPNFWLSEGYLTKQSDVWLIDNGQLMWLQEGAWALFPPVEVEGVEPAPCCRLIGHPGLLKDGQELFIWSDFENYSAGERYEFLDWEYVYDPRHFYNMEGGKWAVFRKNSRKWPKDKDWEYNRAATPNKEVEALLVKWLDNKSEKEEIQDFDTMLNFLRNGERRGFLRYKNQLMGVNVWEYNGDYTMYRYCLTDPLEPFLNEFARLIFYLDVPPTKLVIDGGTLGNPGLERFKDKLNPIKKRPVYSKRFAARR